MEDIQFEKLHIEYLPTEERREYAERLRRYVKYFQANMNALEGKSAPERLIEGLNKKQKQERVQKFNDRMNKYSKLIGKIMVRSHEEYQKQSGDSKTDFNGDTASVGYPIASLSGAAAVVPGWGTLLGGGVAAGAAVLSDLSGLSDKQQLAIYKKAFETAMRLLEESDVSEEKIKSALTDTMNKISIIKEKYGDIADEDLLVQKIQDECVVEIIEGIEKTSDYNKFQQHIENTIGLNAWNKMTQNTQIFLITAELLYDQWKIYGDDIDFAPICMSVSKALEVEVTRRYFIGYLNYLKQHNISLPDELLVRDGGNYREKTEEEFMLGNMTGVTGYVVYLDTETVKLVSRLMDESQRFLKYAKEDLFAGKSEAECTRLIKKHAYSIKKVCVQYRNPSAHKQKITKVSARECLDYMKKKKKIMGEILDECRW